MQFCGNDERYSVPAKKPAASKNQYRRKVEGETKWRSEVKKNEDVGKEIKRVREEIVKCQHSFRVEIQKGRGPGFLFKANKY